jgi:hypothetical protein
MSITKEIIYMSIKAITLLRCDSCIDHYLEVAGSHVTSTSIRKEAKLAGWSSVKTNGRVRDYCPDCTRQKKANK